MLEPPLSMRDICIDLLNLQTAVNVDRNQVNYNRVSEINRMHVSR